ncbi:MAG: MATE family efflux transporter [Erysipelotrichaceae bacterium]|jgi:putative MATE family efflux protein|nr:MATE family efflux transporter [Erysipelotrichaceae bacterium]MCI1326954.1 MATE family efflux transporter [Solobacterium sp.]MCH4045724.1 MATE family efflux transporter [Erysipelotrichaceae bacterium]MCH4122933.1 MATE family efflux transporter [Erysipelotrichaceae bacterium]MCI1363738.1 MATE family efflux transporter [Solobacterium sp.]
MNTKNDMLEGKIGRQILLFFFPIMFGSLFQQLYNTVDAIVVGNFVGKEALGAVGGSTGTVINLLVGFVVGLSSGATVVIAQYYGSRQEEGVRKAVDSSMYLSLILGIVFTIGGILLAPSILHLLKVPDSIYGYSLIYMRLYLAGMVPSLIYNNGAGILRAVGDSKRPLYFLVASCLTNIILDILFVVGFHWSVAGAAIATVLSEVVSCALTLWVLARTEDIYAFKMRNLSVDWKVLASVIVIGFPVGIQSCLYSIANLFIQSSVNGYGTDTVAAFTAFGKIDALFWNSSAALGQAVLTFCGQNFGAGKIDRVKKGIHRGLLMYVIGAGAISLGCMLLGRWIYRLFTPDAGVINIGMQMLWYMCPFWVTFCGVEILSSSMRACGDSIVPMAMTAIGVGAFRILWILFFPASRLFDTLVCYPISWIATSIMFFLYYFQGGWLKRAVRQREKLMAAAK